MGNVQFDEQQSDMSNYKTKLPKLNRWIIKLGFAKDYQKSNKILIFIAIILLALSIFIYLYFVLGMNFLLKKNVDYSKLPPIFQKSVLQNQQFNTNK